jgi:uncharacterized protein YbjT (DUF2867 family)
MSRTAVISGATGLVGAALLDQLLKGSDYSRVIAVSRRPLGVTHPKLSVVQHSLEDFTQPDAALAADDAFCTLGTTTAKSGKVGLERVDYHMVVDFARAVRAAGARRFTVVSSLGASARSPAFYSRVKARMEQAVAEIDFDAVDILRPSLLLGDRQESRPAEALAQRLAPLIAPLFVGFLKPYRPIAASDVARAMIEVTLEPAQGLRIHVLPRG